MIYNSRSRKYNDWRVTAVITSIGQIDGNVRTAVRCSADWQVASGLARIAHWKVANAALLHCYNNVTMVRFLTWAWCLGFAATPSVEQLAPCVGARAPRAHYQFGRKQTLAVVRGKNAFGRFKRELGKSYLWQRSRIFFVMFALFVLFCTYLCLGHERFHLVIDWRNKANCRQDRS